MDLKSESPVRTMNGKKHLVLWMKYPDNCKTKRITEMTLRRIMKAFQNHTVPFPSASNMNVAGPSQAGFSFSVDCSFLPVMVIQIHHGVSYQWHGCPHSRAKGNQCFLIFFNILTLVNNINLFVLL